MARANRDLVDHEEAARSIAMESEIGALLAIWGTGSGKPGWDLRAYGDVDAADSRQAG